MVNKQFPYIPKYPDFIRVTLLARVKCPDELATTRHSLFYRAIAGFGVGIISA